MKFWQTLTWAETEQLADIAESAEQFGFEGVLLSDHLFIPKEINSPYPYSADGKPSFHESSQYPDPWSVAGAILSRTTTLKVSCSLMVYTLRHPIEVAKSAATLSVLSGGRFALGLGVGWGEEMYRAMDIDFKSRGRRADESVEIMRKLWSPGWHSHQGEFFEFDEIMQSPQPKEPVPIYFGGHSKAAMGRAAKVGDGWIGSGNTLEQLPGIMNSIYELRAQYKRSGPFETIIGMNETPSRELFEEMAELGVTSAVSYPFKYTLGERSSLIDKQNLMRDFAQTFINII